MSLTIKQENFCLKFIECGNASEAYRHAYNAEKMKPETVNVKASELMSNGKVTVRVDELRKATTTEAVISVEKRKELLTRWIFEEETNGALKAMEILNKMDGVYVTKSDVSVKGEISHLFASAMEKALK